MSKLKELKRALRDDNGQINILIAQFDPDALASAMGLEYIIQKVSDLKVQIYYFGAIGHPQNRCLINKYDLKRKVMPIKDSDISKDSTVALVDSCHIEDGRLLKEKSDLPIPLVIIDHHRGEVSFPEKEKGFVWVEDVGAASTMIVELLRELDSNINEYLSSEVGSMLATILTLGIYTDTNKLVSGSQRDREAYGFVTQFVSGIEMSELVDYPLSESYFKNLQNALNNYMRKGSRVIAKVGIISGETGDDLSTIADEFLRMQGVTLVVIWGIINKKVRISARSRDLSTPLDEFLAQKFGKSSGAKLAPNGRGEGGAILDLNLGFWYSENIESEIEMLVTNRLREVMFSDLPESSPESNIEKKDT